jgi:hypothetical protein
MSELSQESLTHLRRTHAAGVKLLASSGFGAEAEEVAIQIERHRWFWRPSRPRILLVAESHVFTSDEDSAIRIDSKMLKGIGRPKAPPPPDTFVQLVYCLGYGEPEILRNAPNGHRNPGTINYWDIFRKVTGCARCPMGSSRENLDERLRWKIEALRQLCRQGIWLLDAAVHAIYLGYNHRVPPDIQRILHQQWWAGYGRHVIDSCGETKIWVIGKTVFRCLHALPHWRCRGWVYQPNHDTETNWPNLLDDCSGD